MTTDPYEVCRRIAAEMLNVNLDLQFKSLEPMRQALLAAYAAGAESARETTKGEEKQK